MLHLEKIDCIIQARVGSTRLPRKVLKKLDKKKSMMDFTIEQLNFSKYINNIIIATSIKKEDDKIEEYCRTKKINFFRGSFEDVLDRYYQCAKKFKIKNIVRISGDCPLIDPNVVDKVIEKYNTKKFDYVSNTQPKTFPQGTEVEVFTFNSLEETWKSASLPSEREHVTPYIYKNLEKFKIFNLINDKNLSDLRWVVDRKNDFEFVKILINKIKKRPILTEDILKIIQHNPEIIEINKKNVKDEGYKKSLKTDRKVNN